jgi:hypothetical protein
MSKNNIIEGPLFLILYIEIKYSTRKGLLFNINSTFFVLKEGTRSSYIDVYYVIYIFLRV